MMVGCFEVLLGLKEIVFAPQLEDDLAAMRGRFSEVLGTPPRIYCSDVRW